MQALFVLLSYTQCLCSLLLIAFVKLHRGRAVQTQYISCIYRVHLLSFREYHPLLRGVPFPRTLQGALTASATLCDAGCSAGEGARGREPGAMWGEANAIVLRCGCRD